MLFTKLFNWYVHSVLVSKGYNLKVCVCHRTFLSGLERERLYLNFKGWGGGDILIEEVEKMIIFT